MKNLAKNLLLVFLTALIVAVSLFAVACKGKKAELSFETNGVSSVESVDVKKDTQYSLSEPSHGKDYSFEGWYLTADFSGDPVTEVTVTEDMKVYAKWEKLYAVTLQLDGGSLSNNQENVLYLKKGVKISEALQGYEPTKTGFKFGAWYNGDKELNKNLKMGEAALTLTAKYKAPYTVETYKQNAALDGYDKTEEVKYEYVGKSVSVDDTLAGFNIVSDENSKNTLVVSDNAANNVLRGYYNRNKVSVYFNSNNPDGTVSETVVLDAYYGVETKVPEESYFTVSGYYLKGWADANGNLLFESNYIKRQTGEASAADEFTFERSMTVYAVWERGYTDMFGGSDSIYLVETTNEDGDVETHAYLCRAGYFFEGRYVEDGEGYNIIFDVGGNKEKRVFAKTNPDNTFAYLDSDRAGTYYRFINGKGVDKNDSLIFDNGNGVTYSVTKTDDDNKKTTEQSSGTYVIVENETYGEVYTITFDKGDLKDTQISVCFATYQSEKVFFVYNEEDVNLGKLTRFGVTSDYQLGSYSIYQVEFDGYYGAKYYTSASEYTSYAYYRDGDLVTIYGSSTSMVVKLATRTNGNSKETGYYVYSETLDRTIENADGTKLTLDGMSEITYYDGKNTFSGLYTVTSSVLGGYIINTSFNGETKKFIVNSYTEDDSGSVSGDTSDEKTVVYAFTEKLPSYREYYYAENGTAYLAPLIVIDDETEGSVSIYGYYTYTRVYSKVAFGTYTEIEFSDVDTGETSVYKISVTGYVDPAPTVSKIFYDIDQIETIICSFDSATFGYSLAYWYQVTLRDGTTTSYYETYINGNDTLVLIGQRSVSDNALSSIAVYTKGGNIYLGVTSETVASGTDKETHYESTACLTSFASSSLTEYLQLNHVDKTFSTLKHSPYYAYDYMGGNADGTKYLYVDGNDNATYTENTLDSDKNIESSKVIKGTVVSTDYDSLVLGYDIFKFVSAEGEETLNFSFIRFASSNYIYYSVYEYSDEKCEGLEYNNDDGEYLKLDGFGYYGAYTSLDGKEYRGYYTKDGNAVTLLSVTTEYRYFFFNLTDNYGFKVRGDEYAGSENSAYIIFDNQRMVGQYIYFDGFGKAQLFVFETDDEGNSVRKYIDDNATYTVKDGTITVDYVDGGKECQYVGKTSVFTYSSSKYNSFELTRSNDIIKTYVDNSEWSVLVLDNIGGATRYCDKGAIETGTYRLITDTLMYYVNDEGTDACIYEFNPESGTVVVCESRAYGYYTKDLDTLVFTKYGFVRQNGSITYYYTADKNDNVTLYYYDDTSDNRNEYGFVTQDFGKLTKKITFEENEYYQNSGTSVEFARSSDNAEKYPIGDSSITKLEFTPVGGKTYTAKATITLVTETKKDDETTETEETEVTAYVYKDEADGETYLLIVTTYGTYKMNVTLNYNGENPSACTYTINDLIYQSTLYSQQYVSGNGGYNVFYLMLGYKLENTYGEMTLTTEYDEKGEVAKKYVKGTFGEDCDYVDSQGNRLSFNENGETYEYDSSRGIYTVSVTMPDKYEYQLKFKFGTTYAKYGILYYVTSAFVRVENLTIDEHYSVTVYRIIASDSSASAYWDIELYYDEKLVEYTDAYIINSDIISFGGGIAYVVREFDAETGKVTKSTHYYLTFTEKTDGSVEGNEDNVAVYESATVKVVENTVIYNEDKSYFVEMNGGKVISLVKQTVSEVKDGETTVKKATYSTTFFKTCEQPEEGVYKATVTLTNGGIRTYTITITDGVMTYSYEDAAATEQE